jgi:hypothetical protein
MAEKDSTTKKGPEWLTHQEIQKLMGNLRAIRATADLLCAAGDSIAQGRSTLFNDTLAELAEHLEELATEGLVILRYEGPRIASEPPQAAAQGGE